MPDMETLSKNYKSTVIPGLRDRNAMAMIEWLCRAFGFEKQAAYAGPAGVVMQSRGMRGVAVLLIVGVAVAVSAIAQEPVLPQASAETHTLDSLLGKWTFVEELHKPQFPPKLKGTWTFHRSGDGFMVIDEFRSFNTSGGRRCWERLIAPTIPTRKRGASKPRYMNLLSLDRGTESGMQV
jgi:hypothetical protein